MKKILFTVSVLMFLVLPIVVAQAVMQATVKDELKNRQTAQEKTRVQIENRLNSSSTTSVLFKERILQINAERLRQLEQDRLELKSQIEERIRTLKEEIATKREQLKKTINQRKQLLQEKLKNFRDQNKAKIVLNIQEKVTRLNDLMVDHFSDVLDHLEKTLANIRSRADKAQAAGADISAVTQAMAEAQSKIDAARVAVEAQAGKVYTVNVSDAADSANASSTVLKLDVSKTRKALHDDLTTTRKIVFEAREAVHNAARVLAQIAGVDDIEENAPDDSDDSENDNATSTEN